MSTTTEQLSDADIRALHELIAEHSWLLDHARWQEAAQLYTEDAQLSMGGNTLEGHDAFLAWANQRAANTARRTHHQCTNLRLRASADGTAEGTVMLVLHVSTDSQPAEIEFVGEYRDRYRRDSQGQWRFQKRTLVSITEAE